MKLIPVSDEVYEALQRLAADVRQSPGDALASLLGLPGEALAGASDPLVGFLTSPEFRAKSTDAEKYLAILGWVAARHPGEFQEFVLSLDHGRRFLSPTREQILEQCQHNQARQIPGTSCWAIMNIDTPTKRRFLARVLAFAGYGDDLVDFAGNTIGLRRPRRQPAGTWARRAAPIDESRMTPAPAR